MWFSRLNRTIHFVMFIIGCWKCYERNAPSDAFLNVIANKPSFRMIRTILCCFKYGFKIHFCYNGQFWKKIETIPFWKYFFFVWNYILSNDFVEPITIIISFCEIFRFSSPLKPMSDISIQQLKREREKHFVWIWFFWISEHCHVKPHAGAHRIIILSCSQHTSRQILKWPF